MNNETIAVLVPIRADLGSYSAAESAARQAATRAAAETDRRLATFGLVEQVDRGGLRFADGSDMEIPAGMAVLRFVGEAVPR